MTELARAAGQTGDGLALAAAAHNKAALIASDCGLPDLARSLCWRQYDVYLRARPLGAQAARYTLEPIVNLARLMIRDGDGQGAHELLDTLHRAVKSRTNAVIDGRQLSFRDLTDSDEDQRLLCQWLWTVLLADGTRALASAGQWDRALAHAEQHRGIGRRLLDGRQVAVLARILAGDPASATVLLDKSALSEPWEQPIAACLSVLCRTVGARPADSAIAAMVKHYLRLEPTPGLVLFGVRLGLAVIDLAGGVEHPNASQLTAGLIRHTVAAKDGYAARAVLAHDACTAQLTGSDKRALCATLQSSGIDRGSIPSHLRTDLLAAVTTSEAATARNLVRS